MRSLVFVVVWLLLATISPSAAQSTTQIVPRQASSSGSAEAIKSKDGDVKKREERQTKEKYEESIDLSRFGIAVDLSKPPSSEGFLIVVRAIEAAVQEYISETWAGSSTDVPIYTHPIIETSGIPESEVSVPGGVRRLGQKVDAAKSAVNDERSLQWFQCRFSICSVIGCLFCPRRRHLKDDEGTCFPRNKDIEKLVEKRVKEACKKKVCGDGKVDIYAIQVPAGFELNELTPMEMCR
jgi:hypothetical protein